MERVSIHELKILPGPFAAVRDDVKRFEFRKNDRDFREGDVLLLREWDPRHDDDAPIYTGHEVRATVLYITYAPSWGIPSGFCIMSIRLGT